MVFKFGLTVLDIKDFGKIIRHMAKENFGMLIRIYFKDNGFKIEQMDMDNTSIQTEQNIKGIG